MELEMCAWHHITSFRGKRRWNEIKWESASTSAQNVSAAASVSVLLSHGEREEREREKRGRYSHLCDSQCSGLLAGLCRCASSQAVACHVRHERAARSPLLFIHLLSKSQNPLPLCLHSWFLTLSDSFCCLLPLFTPLTSSSPLRPLTFLLWKSPLTPLFSRSLSPSIRLSLYLPLSCVDSVESWWIRLHVTVWHLSESDAVSMVPADSAVEIIHTGGALRTQLLCVLTCACVHVCLCV